MKRTLLMACIVLSFAGAAESQATSEATRSTVEAMAIPQRAVGPIGEAIGREAARLARVGPEGTVAPSEEAPQRFAPSDWSRVTRLQSGTEIELTAVSAPESRRYVLHADDDGLTVLSVAHPSLPGSVRRRLREIATDLPSALLRAQHTTAVVYADTRIGPDGLFYRGRKLLELDEIVRTFSRPDVLQVSRLERRRSRWVALAGGMVGFVVGARAGLSVGLRQCGRSCSDEGVLTALSFIGLPIGTGALAYYATRHTAEIIEYRAYSSCTRNQWLNQ
jgi:hypothetical protein